MYLELQEFFDGHAHIRLGAMLGHVLPFTTWYCHSAVIMPNTKPRPILKGKDVAWYRAQIKGLLPKGNRFEPIMTIEIRDTTTPEDIKNAFRAGAKAGKVYPRGVTNNSENGLRDFFSDNMLAVWATMQELGMLLLLHGEHDRDELDLIRREEAFLPTLFKLNLLFPRLRIVLEHVSSRKGVEAVLALPAEVAGTITLHHLIFTQNDVLGSGVQPHHACMPTPKLFDDRNALREVVFSGNPKFFLGSDTAPHLRENKECENGACGIFSAPVLAPLLVQLFMDHNKLHLLQNFTSGFGIAFYGLTPWDKTFRLKHETWIVPHIYHGIVPLWAKKTIEWKLQ